MGTVSTWIGKNSTKWSDSGNWDTGMVPGVGDTAMFLPGKALKFQRADMDSGEAILDSLVVSDPKATIAFGSMTVLKDFKLEAGQLVGWGTLGVGDAKIKGDRSWTGGMITGNAQPPNKLKIIVYAAGVDCLSIGSASDTNVPTLSNADMNLVGPKRGAEIARVAGIFAMSDSAKIQINENNSLTLEGAKILAQNKGGTIWNEGTVSFSLHNEVDVSYVDRSGFLYASKGLNDAPCYLTLNGGVDAKGTELKLSYTGGRGRRLGVKNEADGCLKLNAEARFEACAITGEVVLGVTSRGLFEDGTTFKQGWLDVPLGAQAIFKRDVTFKRSELWTNYGLISLEGGTALHFEDESGLVLIGATIRGLGADKALISVSESNVSVSQAVVPTQIKGKRGPVRLSLISGSRLQVWDATLRLRDSVTVEVTGSVLTLVGTIHGAKVLSDGFAGSLQLNPDSTLRKTGDGLGVVGPEIGIVSDGRGKAPQIIPEAGELKLPQSSNQRMTRNMSNMVVGR